MIGPVPILFFLMGLHSSFFHWLNKLYLCCSLFYYLFICFCVVWADFDSWHFIQFPSLFFDHHYFQLAPVQSSLLCYLVSLFSKDLGFWQLFPNLQGLKIYFGSSSLAENGLYKLFLFYQAFQNLNILLKFLACYEDLIQSPSSPLWQSPFPSNLTSYSLWRNRSILMSNHEHQVLSLSLTLWFQWSNLHLWNLQARSILQQITFE